MCVHRCKNTCSANTLLQKFTQVECKRWPAEDVKPNNPKLSSARQGTRYTHTTSGWYRCAWGLCGQVGGWVGECVRCSFSVFLLECVLVGVEAQAGTTQNMSSVQDSNACRHSPTTATRQECRIWMELKSKPDTQRGNIRFLLLYACWCPPDFHTVTDRYK